MIEVWRMATEKRTYMVVYHFRNSDEDIVEYVEATNVENAISQIKAKNIQYKLTFLHVALRDVIYHNPNNYPINIVEAEIKWR